MYLEWHDPNPIHVNPYFALQDDPTPERNGQVVQAASLVSAALWFINSIHNQAFAPDRKHGECLCMHQYSVLLSTTRIPQPWDKTVTNYGSKHIVVVSRTSITGLRYMMMMVGLLM